MRQLSYGEITELLRDSYRERDSCIAELLRDSYRERQLYSRATERFVQTETAIHLRYRQDIDR